MVWSPDHADGEGELPRNNLDKAKCFLTSTWKALWSKFKGSALRRGYCRVTRNDHSREHKRTTFIQCDYIERAPFSAGKFNFRDDWCNLFRYVGTQYVGTQYVGTLVKSTQVRFLSACLPFQSQFIQDLTPCLESRSWNRPFSAETKHIGMEHQSSNDFITFFQVYFLFHIHTDTCQNKAYMIQFSITFFKYLYNLFYRHTDQFASRRPTGYPTIKYWEGKK